MWTSSAIKEYGENFTPRHYSEFEDRNGVCSILSIENPYDNGYIYPDGTKLGEYGSLRFFDIEAMEWKKVRINSDGTICYETVEVINANLPFYPNCDDEGRTKWENSIHRAYLNGIATKGADFTKYGNFITEALNPDREGTKEFVIPEGQERIGDYAIQAATHLKTISVPNTIRTIGIHPFRFCTGLEELKFMFDDKQVPFSIEDGYGLSSIERVDPDTFRVELAGENGCREKYITSSGASDTMKTPIFYIAGHPDISVTFDGTKGNVLRKEL